MTQNPDNDLANNQCVNMLNTINCTLESNPEWELDHAQFQRMKNEYKWHQNRTMWKANPYLETQEFKVIVETLQPIDKTAIIDKVERGWNQIYDRYAITPIFDKTLFETENDSASLSKFSLQFEIQTFCQFLDTTNVQSSLDILTAEVQNLFRSENNQLSKKLFIVFNLNRCYLLFVRDTSFKSMQVCHQIQWQTLWLRYEKPSQNISLLRWPFPLCTWSADHLSNMRPQ